ncbi:GXWXG protein-domain-containing protein [Mycena vulgaris]|nr:GXWXG protein-domain-containing protein [Mycena vulgaris]
MTMSLPEQAYLDLIKAGGKASEDAITKIFDLLRPVEPSFLMGEWEGGFFDTGHPATPILKEMNWVGKNFLTEEDVEPIIVRGEGGQRIFKESYGRARVREIKFRGVVSAAVVYDDRPAIDYFRYVNGDTAAGMVDDKMGVPGFHFYLTRHRGIDSSGKGD